MIKMWHENHSEMANIVILLAEGTQINNRNCLVISGGASWGVILPRPTPSILHDNIDLDRSLGDWIHWVPKERRAWPWEEAVPWRKVLWPSWLGLWPRKEGHPSIGWDQACSPCHGCFPWLCSPSCGNRQRSSQQLGYPLERPPSHNHYWHLHLLKRFLCFEYILLHVLFICAFYVVKIYNIRQF